MTMRDRIVLIARHPWMGRVAGGLLFAIGVAVYTGFFGNMDNTTAAKDAIIELDGSYDDESVYMWTSYAYCILPRLPEAGGETYKFHRNDRTGALSVIYHGVERCHKWPPPRDILSKMRMATPLGEKRSPSKHQA